MITKFCSYKSLVNNDNTSAENFSQNRIFRTFLDCKFSSFSCKSQSMPGGYGLKIQGLATTYHNADCVKDVLTSNAFSSQISNDGCFTSMPHMYYEHNSSYPSPGKWSSVKLLSIGIQVEGVIYDKKIISLIMQEKLSGLSIGFFVNSSYSHYNKINDRTYRYIDKAELVEISLVSKPANPKAFLAPVDLTIFGANVAPAFNQVSIE